MSAEEAEKSPMNFSFRRLLQDMATYGAGDILVKAVGFLTVPVYTHAFSPADMGLMGVVTSTVGLVNAVLILGGDTAYARYYFEAKSDDERQCVTFTWFTFLVLWSVVAVGLLVIFAGPLASTSTGSSENVLLVRLALVTLPVSLLNTMCGQALRNQFRAGLFSILSAFKALLLVASIVLAVVVLKQGVCGAFAAILLVDLLLLPVRLWSIRNLLRPSFRWRLLVDLLAYGVPLVPGSLAYWLFGSFDRVLLGRMSGLDQVGLLSVAAKVTMPLELIRGALGTAWFPHALSLYKYEQEQGRILIGKTATYVLALGGFLVVFFSSFAREALVLFTTPAYYLAETGVAPLALGLFAYISTKITSLGITFTNKTYYLALLTWLTSGISIGLNLLLIPRWGMLGVAWANMISYAFLTIAYLFISQRLWKITYQSRRVLIVVGVTFALSVMAQYIPLMPLFGSLIVKSFYCLSFVGFLFLLRVFGRYEMESLLSMLPKSPELDSRPRSLGRSSGHYWLMSIQNRLHGFRERKRWNSNSREH